MKSHPPLIHSTMNYFHYYLSIDFVDVKIFERVHCGNSFVSDKAFSVVESSETMRRSSSSVA